LLAAHWGLSSGALSTAAAVTLQALATYALFTPAHDAVHLSVATRESGVGWLNGVVGRAVAIPLLAPWVAFRYIHLLHHKHTNHPDSDPDNWSGAGPRWLLPLRWATQYYHYVYLYLSRLGQRPRAEVAEALTQLLGTYAAIGALCVAGYASYALLHVVLPAQLAHTFLAFSFDYLPHRPNVKQGLYVDTAVIALSVPSPAGPGSLLKALAWPLTLPLLSQNYHVVHHLVPWVPFYRYAAVFEAHASEMEARGTRALPLFPIYTPLGH
jgi:beta-carotene hydroxylase